MNDSLGNRKKIQNNETFSCLMCHYKMGFYNLIKIGIYNEK